MEYSVQERYTNLVDDIDGLINKWLPDKRFAGEYMQKILLTYIDGVKKAVVEFKDDMKLEVGKKSADRLIVELVSLHTKLFNKAIRKRGEIVKEFEYIFGRIKRLGEFLS